MSVIQHKSLPPPLPLLLPPPPQNPKPTPNIAVAHTLLLHHDPI
jgi:hypothetical protein